MTPTYYTLNGTLQWFPAGELPDEEQACQIVADALGVPVDTVQVRSIAKGPWAEVTAASDPTQRHVPLGYPEIDFEAGWKSEA